MTAPRPEYLEAVTALRRLTRAELYWLELFELRALKRQAEGDEDEAEAVIHRVTAGTRIAE